MRSALNASLAKCSRRNWCPLIEFGTKWHQVHLAGCSKLLIYSTSPSTSSDSTRSNEKGESRPDESSPPPAITTVLNSSDSSDVHAIALRTLFVREKGLRYK